MPHRTEAELRQEIVTIARIAADKGLITSSDGNLSIRLDEDRVLVTPSGVYKWRMQPEDLVIVDMRGQKLAGPPHLRATSEVKLHLEVYRQRPDVDAVPTPWRSRLRAFPFPSISSRRCCSRSATCRRPLTPRPAPRIWR